MTARRRGLGSVGQWSGLLISAVLLLLILRQFHDLGTAVKAVQAADIHWLLAGALLYLVGFLPRGLRWGRLLVGVCSIPLGHLTAVEAIGFMANNILPFRLGELVRAYTIGRKAKISATSALATIVMERLCDGLTLVLGLAVIALFYPFPTWVKQAGIAAALLFFGATAFLALLAYQRETARRLVAFLARPLPGTPRQVLADLVERFDDGLHLLRSPLDAAAVAALSVLVWAVELGVYLCVLAAFAEPIRRTLGHALPLHDTILLMILVNFGSIVPSGPAYIGTFQAVAIAVLTSSSGMSEPVAFSIAWVLWATMVVPIVAVGFACLAGEELSLGTVIRFRPEGREGRAPSVDWKPNRHAGPGGSG